MVVLEFAMESWFVEDNEKLVWFKTFLLRFVGDYTWQVLGSVALELRLKGGTRSMDL